MQYAILVNSADVDSLEVLTNTARHLVALYESEEGGGPKAAFQIPILAYMRAIGIA